MLIVRIVGKPEEIAVQLPSPAEQLVRVGQRKGPAAAQRVLLMEADPAQEQGLPVEEDIVAAHRDRAKTDFVGQAIRFGGDRDRVEFGTVRRPERKSGRGQLDRGDTVGAGRAPGGEGQFRDGDRDLLDGLCSVEPHADGDAVAGTGGEVDGTIGDEGGGRRDEPHLAGEPAIIPPIGHDRGNTGAPSLVVHADHERVAAGLEQRGRLEGKRREATHVMAEFVTVEIDIGFVVGRAEPEENTGIRAGRCVIEQAAVPDGPLVVEQSFVLGVPVAGHREKRAGIEAVLDQIGLRLGPAIEEEPAGRLGGRVVGLQPIVVIPGVVRIDDPVPLSVQVETGAEGGVDRGGSGGQSGQEEKTGRFQEAGHKKGGSCGVHLCAWRGGRGSPSNRNRERTRLPAGLFSSPRYRHRPTAASGRPSPRC